MFAPSPPLPPCVPVSPLETVRPTRVVYRHAQNRRLTTLIFPTRERAFDFAANEAEVIVIQDVTERPPAQDTVVNRRFVKTGSGAAILAAMGAERR